MQDVPDVIGHLLPVGLVKAVARLDIGQDLRRQRAFAVERAAGGGEHQHVGNHDQDQDRGDGHGKAPGDEAEHDAVPNAAVPAGKGG
jgi:hypothetical protein